jgi:ferric-dicitrate binding protein FerR (iron transport regulator)
MKIPFNTEKLINYLRKEDRPQDRELVEQWIRKDQANKKFVEQFSQFWLKLDTAGEQKTIDVDEAWTRTSQRLTPPGRKLKFWPTLAAAVAVLVLIIGSYQWWENSQWTKIQTADFKQELALPDGSMIHLNHNSKLAYRMKKELRLIQLEGEAHFDVKRNVNRPFSIQTPSGKVEVLGTSFNVNARKYHDFERVFVTDGKVAFSHRTGDQTIFLSKGDLGVLDVNKQKLIKENTDASNDLAWKTGSINFENASIDEIKRVMMSVYNSSVSIDDSFRNRTVNVAFKNQSLEEVLNVVALLLNGQLKKEGKNYRIEK